MYKLNLGRDLYLKGRIGWRGLSKDEYLEDGEYRIINATALMDGYVDWDNCGYITQERYEESEEIMLQEGDILISKDGTLGKIGYVKGLSFPCTVASGIFVLRNTLKEELDFDYLYHILKSHIFKDFIYRNKATGSTINHLYQVDLERFELDLPDIGTQRKIAEILNDIDSKIENNNGICHELEDLSQYLYEYWFVQFDFPDKAGKPYKTSGGKMKWDDELNQNIPIDWNHKLISDITRRVKVGFVGTVDKYYCDKKDGVQIVRPAEMSEDGIDYDNLRYVTYEFHNSNLKSQAHYGDILISRCGKEGIPNVYDSTDESQVLNAVMIEPNPDVAESLFINEVLKTKYSQIQIENGTSGSVQGVINTEMIGKIKLAFNEKVCKEYVNRLKEAYGIISNLRDENRKLRELRTFILPMLLNGQICVN